MLRFDKGVQRFHLDDYFSSLSFSALLTGENTDIAARTAQFGAASINIKQTVDIAKQRAKELGLGVDDDCQDQREIASANHRLVEFMIYEEPLSADWYLVKIYTINRQLTLLRANPLKGTSEGFIVHTAVQLGAFCREYELSQANKALTLVRKRQLQAFLSDSGGQRSVVNAERRRIAGLWKAEARKIALELSERGSSLKGAAKEEHIRRKLLSRGFKPVALSSIRRALGES
ncbi:MAG: hypothetical protein U1E59_12350 [Amaricoccus sp.]